MTLPADVIFEVHTFDRKNKKTKVGAAVKVESFSGEEKELSKAFFIKDPKTSLQKRIFCLPCVGVVESLPSWKQHVAGDKHSKNLDLFAERAAELRKSLKDISSCDTLVGLRMVVEYRCPASPYAQPPYYECLSAPCSRASGSTFQFLKHLETAKHRDGYLNEIRKTEERSDWSQMRVIIDDQEKYRKLSLGFHKEIRATSSSSSSTNNSVTTTSTITPSSGLFTSKRKLDESSDSSSSSSTKTDVKKAKLETKALKAKRPGFTDERYNETSYFFDSETKLRKVYPYYFTFTTFTKGRWVGEKILDVFSREFRAHPAEEYERCIKAGTLTVNYEKVELDYRLKHNDLLANVVHRHEVPVSSERIKIIHMDDEMVVVNKPASIPVHPCGRYRHNTVVFILAKEYGLKNLRTIHRLDRLTSGLLLFGRNPKKAREMEQQIRTRQCKKEYVCRVEGEFPREKIVCEEPIEVISYKIGVCKVSAKGKDCYTEFQRLNYNGRTSVVLCKPHTGRMHQIRVHLQFLGYPVMNDPLYNHPVFGPLKGKDGNIGKTDDQLIQDLISIHNAENWLGMDDTSGGGGSGASLLLPPSNTIESNDSSSTPASSANIPSGYNGKPGLRADTPDSAVDMASSTADSPLETFHADPSPSVGSSKIEDEEKVHTGTQTGIEEADTKFDDAKMTFDSHCYECKVKYRDPKPKDLIMFLHAVRYSGPDWVYSTDLPHWALETWTEIHYDEN